MWILISLIESFYIYYMFNIFETRITFTHPFEKFSLNYLNESVSERIYSYFKHPINNSAFPESKICPFGKKITLLLSLYIAFRHLIPLLFKINNLVLLLSVSLSLSNLNAFVYLIPYLIIEIIRIIFTLY